MNYRDLGDSHQAAALCPALARQKALGLRLLQLLDDADGDGRPVARIVGELDWLGRSPRRTRDCREARRIARLIRAALAEATEFGVDLHLRRPTMRRARGWRS